MVQQEPLPRCQVGCPIVLFGGFASPWMVYLGLQRTLAQVSGQQTWIVKTESLDWLPSIAPGGWVVLLDKLHGVVRQAAASSPTGRVTLVGHSAGGVLARLYLGAKSLRGRSYGGLDYVEHLITLGSPHHNRQRWLHGGMMSRWIEQRFPGAFFADRVRYTCVVGKLLRGDRSGAWVERHAFRFYQRICGEGNVWGDGLVPVSCALLEGGAQVVMDRVGHFVGFGTRWYGSPEVVAQWWQACVGS